MLIPLLLILELTLLLLPLLLLLLLLALPGKAVHVSTSRWLVFDQLHMSAYLQRRLLGDCVPSCS